MCHKKKHNISPAIKRTLYIRWSGHRCLFPQGPFQHVPTRGNHRPKRFHFPLATSFIHSTDSSTTWRTTSATCSHLRQRLFPQRLQYHNRSVSPSLGGHSRTDFHGHRRLFQQGVVAVLRSLSTHLVRPHPPKQLAASVLFVYRAEDPLLPLSQSLSTAGRYTTRPTTAASMPGSHGPPRQLVPWSSTLFLKARSFDTFPLSHRFKKPLSMSFSSAALSKANCCKALHLFVHTRCPDPSSPSFDDG